jgi:hypothetical protein
MRGLVVLVLGLAAATPRVYKGLEVDVKSVERSTNVSLQDCPPGENTVRGVIRPVEENEFATVRIEIEVLPSFEPVELAKPLLYDDAGKEYKTAQTFGKLDASPSYSCSFSFRVPKGTKLARFVIEEATFDLTGLED